jgi:uncharacterized membrane protein
MSFISKKTPCKLVYRSNQVITTYFNIAKQKIQTELNQEIPKLRTRNLSKIITKVFFTIFVYYKMKLNQYIINDDYTIEYCQKGKIEEDLKPENINDNDKGSYYYKIKEKVINYIKKNVNDLDGILSKTNLDIMKDATKPNEFNHVYSKVTGIKQKNNFEKTMNTFRSITYKSKTKSKNHWDEVDGGRSNTKTKKNHGK